MAYTKNTWKKGDVVTAAKLNNLEDGVSEGLLKVFKVTDTVDGATHTLDKTWKEISDAVADGCVPFIFTTYLNTQPEASYDGTIIAIVTCVQTVTVGATVTYVVYSFNGESSSEYACNSENGYPTSGGSS